MFYAVNKMCHYSFISFLMYLLFHVFLALQMHFHINNIFALYRHKFCACYSWSTSILGMECYWSSHTFKMHLKITTWKCSYSEFFCPNAEKYGTEKQIQTLFSQWLLIFTITIIPLSRKVPKLYCVKCDQIQRFLVRIFPYLDWIQSKYREIRTWKTLYWTLFTQFIN